MSATPAIATVYRRHCNVVRPSVRRTRALRSTEWDVIGGRLKLHDWTLSDRFGRGGHYRTTYGPAYFGLW